MILYIVVTATWNRFLLKVLRVAMSIVPAELSKDYVIKAMKCTFILYREVMTN